MDVVITPPPRPEEREALIVALERRREELEAGLPAPYRSDWRRAGLLGAARAEGAYAVGPLRDDGVDRR